MSFPTYAHYKDSGVEWLGEVPAHWEVLRLANLFQQMAEEGADDLPILSVSIHSGVSDKEMNEEEMDRKVTRSDDRSKYKRVMPGDLVYNMMRAWQGGFGAVTIAGMVSPAYVVARPTRIFVTEFVEQQLRTPNAVEEMRRHSQGVTDFRLRLYWEEFKTLQVVLPPIEDQRRIMDELSGETSKIDALITEQRTLIDLLKEKRQAVISHAVTKGLDPRVPMKDSGVEWLGEVPAHWETTYLKHVSAIIIDCPHETPIYSTDGEFFVIRTADISDGRLLTNDLYRLDGEEYEKRTRRGKLNVNDIVYGREGERWGHAALVPSGKLFCLGQRMVQIRIRESVSAHYFMWQLNSDSTYKQGHVDIVGATAPHVNMGTIINYAVAVPPKPEQIKIANFIERECQIYDDLTAEAQTTIALLQERRSALISAAVTGKIDVRGTAPEAA
jgi:type I restriction enzyme, S subunit